MIAATIISLFLSVIAILLSVGSVYYTRRQTKIAEEQKEQKQREDKAMAEWAAKFDEAVSAILKIDPQWVQMGSGSTNAFGVAFPDPGLRQRIESHLIVGKLGHAPLGARQMGRDQLLSPYVQKTITDVLDCVRKFKQAWPNDAQKIGL